MPRLPVCGALGCSMYDSDAGGKMWLSGAGRTAAHGSARVGVRRKRLQGIG
ncbi:hypothetical protein ACFL0B_07395 [Thermodesulfobacteriota bacterium]